MQCLFPYHVENPRYTMRRGRMFFDEAKWIPVPCGTCPACLKRRANAWGFRLTEHFKVYPNALFVTLTYDEFHVPISEAGFMTLCVKDFQKYMKRLRNSYMYKKFNPITKRWNNCYDKVPKISYYCAGEYGSKNFRPHFHAILFGTDEEHARNAWHCDGVLIGDVHFGTCEAASISYCTKYMTKGRIIPVHSGDDRVPEFALMSKYLGVDYLTNDVIKWHRQDLLRSFVMHNGFKIPLPRYFKDKIFTKEELEIQNEILRQRAEESEGKRMAAFVKRTGSIDGYTKSQYEGKVAMIRDYHKLQRDKRKDI